MTIAATFSAFTLIFFTGCDSTQSNNLTDEVELNTTIGSLARIYQSGSIQVRGWGIVAGLNGTGSSECDPTLRRQLVKHIQKKTGDNDPVAANVFLNSKDTAVVDIVGTIPALAKKGDRFDIAVSAMPETQTVSLEGGTLYAADLKEMARIFQYDQYVKTIAEAEGAVFINKIDADPDKSDPRKGHVLGGGSVLEAVRISINLIEPNYYVSSAIRNQLNKRFGTKTARAVSPALIELSVPFKYRNTKERFLEMVNQTFLVSSPQLERDRIDKLVDQLVTDENKVYPELALEAIGNSALYKLTSLLQSDNPAVRFHAARCMMAIGDFSSLTALEEFSKEKDGKFRLEAVEAIGMSAPKSQAIKLLTPLLSEENFEVRTAAYEQLLALNANSVSRVLIGDEFFVDSVIAPGKPIIYFARSTAPRIVLFADPIQCSRNLFLTSPDGQVTMNSKPGQNGISLMREHPKSTKLTGPITSSYRLKDIINALGNSPIVKKGQRSNPGLAVAYSEIAAILKKMCDTKMVDARFIVEPMPKIISITKPKETVPEKE